MATTDPRLQLPPFPAQATPGDYVWVDWWRKLQDYMKAITEVQGAESFDDVTTPQRAYEAHIWVPGDGVDPGYWNDISIDEGRWMVVGNVCTFQFKFPLQGSNLENATHEGYIETGVIKEFAMPAFPEECVFPFTIVDLAPTLPHHPPEIRFHDAGVAIVAGGYPTIRLPRWDLTSAVPVLSEAWAVISGSYVFK